MTNKLYGVSKSKMLSADFDWNATDWRLTAWSGTPDYSLADITIGNITARGLATLRGYGLSLTGKTFGSAGIARSNPAVIPGITAGFTITFFVLCKFNATQLLSEPLMYIDDAVNLPWVSNGLDLTVQPDLAQGGGWFTP